MKIEKIPGEIRITQVLMQTAQEKQKESTNSTDQLYFIDLVSVLGRYIERLHRCLP